MKSMSSMAVHSAQIGTYTGYNGVPKICFIFKISKTGKFMFIPWVINAPERNLYENFQKIITSEVWGAADINPQLVSFPCDLWSVEYRTYSIKRKLGLDGVIGGFPLFGNISCVHTKLRIPGVKSMSNWEYLYLGDSPVNWVLKGLDFEQGSLDAGTYSRL